MSDLVRGAYAVTAPVKKFTGGAGNVTQGNLSARSNSEWLGWAGVTSTALAATGVALAVAIPVEYGDVITTVSLPIGATATTPTHSWAALYSGIAVPALLAQSADGTTVQTFTANTTVTFTLASPVVVTPVNAPNGFLYASVQVTSGGSPTSGAVTVATAVQYQYFANSPLFLAASHGSGLTATAPATIASPTTVATIPLAFLR